MKKPIQVDWSDPSFAFYRDFIDRLTKDMERDLAHLAKEAIATNGQNLSQSCGDQDAKFETTLDRIELTALMFLVGRDELPNGQLRNQLEREGKIKGNWHTYESGERIRSAPSGGISAAIPPTSHDRGRGKSKQKQISLEMNTWNEADEKLLRRLKKECKRREGEILRLSGKQKVQLQELQERRQALRDRLTRQKDVGASLAEASGTAPKSPPEMKHTQAALFCCAAIWEELGGKALMRKDATDHEEAETEFESWFTKFLDAVGATVSERAGRQRRYEWLLEARKAHYSRG